MAPIRFVIPLQRKDLLRGDPSSQYVVENEYSIRELKTKLVDIQLMVKQRGSEFLLKGGFDVIFSVLELFNKELPLEYKSKAFEILADGMDDMIRQIDAFVGGSDISNDREKLNLANKMKMVTYLMCQLMELIEADVLQKESANVANKKQRKKNNAMDDESWNWEGRRLDAITLMYRLLSLNINALFDPPIVEEEMINLIGNCVFRVFENPGIAHQRLKDVRLGLIQVLGLMMSKHGYSLSCTLKIVQSLKHFEHLAAPLAEAVDRLSNDFNCRSLVMAVVQEITRLDTRELSRDTSGTRAFSQFLVEIGERVPDQLQPCLSLLQLHLDGDSYMLRKSILSIFTEMVLKLYSNDNLDEDAKETRDQYLDLLEDHLHDVHAHVRSSVLQSWCKLCLAKAIPLARIRQLLKLVVGRIRDRSSNVRKQSVQLLTLLLQCNPFNSTLDVEEIREQYEKQKATLEEMLPKDKSEEEAKKIAEEKANQWSKIEKKLDSFDIENDITEENSDYLWENASPGEVHERIRHHLTQNRFAQAISLLEEAKTKEEFAVFKNLERDGNVDIIGQLQTIFFMPLFRETAQVEEDPAHEAHENAELEKQKFLVNYLKDSMNFITGLNEALPTICTLLGSKSASDVQEAIGFFVSAFEFGLYNAMIGVRKMLSLIFSREQSVKGYVVAAYKRLYIESSAGSNDKVNPVQLVRNLTELISGATIGDLTGLEELIGMLVKSEDLDKNCFQVMWQMFTRVMPESSLDQARACLQLLGMVGNVSPNVISANINVLIEHGLENGDYKMAHDTCLVLLKIPASTKSSSPDVPPFRLPQDHELFQKLDRLIMEGIDNTKDDHYIPMAQQAIMVIYQLSDEPDKRTSEICRKLSLKLAEKPKSTVLLRRTYAVVGHVAVGQLNYLDAAVFTELKRRNTLREMKKEKDKVAANEKKTGKRRASARIDSPRVPRASLGSAGNNEEDDMGVMGAEADDHEAEYIRGVCEKEIVTGTENLLSLFAKPLVEVCMYPDKYMDTKLRTHASIALAKFMLVSEEFCEEQLQLLFTVLERSPEPVIRGNIIIATGDLSFRFPNTLEPWTPRMYACLRDGSALVRSNTVTVLTHLILNDMIKVKGQISDMALCIMDEHEKISNMAKLFFTELSRKGNALYNVMPDIVSRLSDPAANIDEEKFKEIMRYIIGLIDKDKHLESLVEKLCHRFHATSTERQWRDLAFCLSLFAYNEKAAKKFIDSFSCFSDKLHEDFVHEAVQNIMTQCKKLPKQETKMAIDELALKVEEARNKCVEDHGAGVRAKNANNDEKATTNNKTKKNNSKTPARKNRKNESSSEEEADDVEEEEEKRPTRKSGRVTKPKKNVVQESSDDEEEDDEEEESEDNETEDGDEEGVDNDENVDQNRAEQNKRQASQSPAAVKDKKIKKKRIIQDSSEEDPDDGDGNNADDDNDQNQSMKKRQASKSPLVNGKGRDKKKSNSSESTSSPIKPTRTTRTRRVR